MSYDKRRKTIKAIVTFVVLGLLVISSPAHGRMNGVGLGIIAGEPTGLSAKKWLDGKSALDGALAWSLVDGTAIQIHIDYMRHIFDFVSEINDRTPLYYGVGARMKLKSNDGKSKSDDARLGLRIPLGLTHLFEKEPIDVFVEIVPILDVTPKTEIRLNGAVGVRYYFK